MKENCSLLPLVLSNNQNSRFKISGVGNIYFLCQFHNEKTPSMCVTFTNNLYYCFGCGSTGNSFDYLMNYENISFINSVYLLARIYNISLPNNPILEDDILVKKYKDALLSEQYIEMLDIILKKNEKYICNTGKGDDVRYSVLCEKNKIEEIKNRKMNNRLITKKLKLEFPRF